MRTVFCPPPPEPHVFFSISGGPADEIAPDLESGDSAPGSDRRAVIWGSRWVSLGFHCCTATFISVF